MNLEKIYFTIQYILSFLVGGTKCVSCQNLTYFPCICKKCIEKIYSYEALNLKTRCSHCGKILISEIELCNECKIKKEEDSSFLVDKIFPIHMYRLWLKDLVYVWKKEGFRALSYVFAELFARAIIEIKKDFSIDSVVCIPIRPGKLKKKGWDQMNDIKNILQKKYSIKIEDIFERSSSNEQKKLSKKDRIGFLGAEYRLKEDFIKKGGSYLILDDVVTTASTMEKCSKLLKNKGVKNVYALSLFIVD